MFSDHDIKAALAKGHIRIEPFDERALQPASVDLRLGRVFWFYTDWAVESKQVIDPQQSPRQYMERYEAVSCYELEPQGFVLGSTQEKISLGNNVVGRIEGKSSLARLGLSVHSTGGFIDPGNQNLNITLEIANHSPLPIRLYLGMWIAQIAFQYTLSPCDRPYGPERGSRYYGDSEPIPSRIAENLK